MMGFFDRLKKGGPAQQQSQEIDELPTMDADNNGTLAGALKGSRSSKDARVAAAATAKATAEAENEGLPSVNRKKGGNKLVTVLGFMFILGAAAAMVVAVNGDKKPKTKKAQGSEAQVMNNLPPIVIPTAPPALHLAAANPGTQAAADAGTAGTLNGKGTTGGLGTAANAGGSQPIPVQGTPGAGPGGAGAKPTGANGKPPMEWWDRKMAGALTVDNKQQQGGGQGSGSGRAASVADSDPAHASFGTPGARAGGNSDLSTRLEPTVTRAVTASMLPDRNFLITKGTALDCALETALDSSVPGITTCRLTRDVYSDNGRVLLMDRGSTLVGEYQSGVRQGQVRMFVLWTRAKTPNGVVVSLNSPGTDALGRSGLEGWVDNHFIERFGAAILMSLVKDTVPAVANRNSQGGGNTTNYYGSAAAGGEKIIEKILESTVNIPPTIIKNQGDHIQVMVARDLDFSSVYGLRAIQ